MIIWLASYPKSGNTWLRLFLRAYFLTSDKNFSINEEGASDYEAKTFPNYNLLIDNKIELQKFEEIVKNWLTLQEYINLNNKINFLKTHNGNFNINGFPFTNSENTIGGIYIVRDPRDVALSLTNHFSMTKEEAVKNMTNMEHYELDDKNVSKGFKRSILGTWSSNYSSWRYYQARNIHLVKYEDMVKNPTTTFKNILFYLSKFLPLKIEEKKIQLALEQTSFNNLSKMEMSSGFIEVGSGDKFFRKGIVGEWKNKLEPDLVNKIEEAFKKEMVELNYL